MRSGRSSASFLESDNKSLSKLKAPHSTAKLTFFDNHSKINGNRLKSQSTRPPEEIFCNDGMSS